MTRPMTDPEIPSEMDDWDTAFKERTGAFPDFSRLNNPRVRNGQPTSLSFRPGDLIFSVPFLPEPRWYAHSSDGRVIDAGEMRNG